jgi:hypothetical protein
MSLSRSQTYRLPAAVRLAEPLGPLASPLRPHPGLYHASFPPWLVPIARRWTPPALPWPPIPPPYPLRVPDPTAIIHIGGGSRRWGGLGARIP